MHCLLCIDMTRSLAGGEQTQFFRDDIVVVLEGDLKELLGRVVQVDGDKVIIAPTTASAADYVCPVCLKWLSRGRAICRCSRASWPSILL
jgi:hypothetical protein